MIRKINLERAITPSITKTEKKIITKKSETKVNEREATKKKITINLINSKTRRLKRRLEEKYKKRIRIKGWKKK